MHRKRKKERYVEEDDGRSFANMNVEGMPWYRPPQEGDAKKGDIPQLSPKEYKYFMWGVLKAALLVGLVFSFLISLCSKTKKSGAHLALSFRCLHSDMPSKREKASM